MKTSEKYITETDTNYRVRIRINKGRLVKCYSFDKWGGKDRAFLLAVQWRDKTLKKYGLTDRLKYIKSPDLFTNGSKINPIIGVYETQTSGNFNWTARVKLNGEEIKRHFSVRKFGNRSAFLEACQIRFKTYGKLIVINRAALPCMPNVPYKFQKPIEV